MANRITRQRLPAQNPTMCTLSHPETSAIDQKLQTTRSAAVLELWQPYLAEQRTRIGPNHQTCPIIDVDSAQASHWAFIQIPSQTQPQ